MNYREVEVLAAESITVAGTRTLDINITEPISKISVTIKKLNTNNTPIAHPMKIIKNITICDGADILFSMNGSDAAALDYYSTNIQPPSIINYCTGQYSVQMVQISFGRNLYDEQLALVPSKYSNLQIKVEHDIALGGSTGTVGYMQIYAHCFDEKVINPVGFLYNKEIYSYLPVANAIRYIDVPTDYRIRAIMFGANECTEGPNFNVERVKLTENQGKHHLIESQMHFYMYQSGAYYDPWNDMVYVRPSGTSLFTYYLTPHFERFGHMMNTGATNAVQNTSAAGCTAQLAMATAPNVAQGMVFGHNPFGQTWLKTHGGDTIDDCWDIASFGSGRLELTAAAGPDVDEYVRVYTQQIRDY